MTPHHCKVDLDRDHPALTVAAPISIKSMIRTQPQHGPIGLCAVRPLFVDEVALGSLPAFHSVVSVGAVRCDLSSCLAIQKNYNMSGEIQVRTCSLVAKY